MTKALDLTGIRFGFMTALKRVDTPEKKKGNVFWECVCDCGRKVVLNTSNLRQIERRGLSRCRCPYDHTGQRFGRLLVLGPSPKRKGHQNEWICLCDCGNTKIVLGGCLRSESTKSCGCLSEENSKTVNLKHGMSGADKAKEHPEYRMFWCAHRRAKKRGLEFDLDYSDIVVPEFCPLLGVKMKLGSKIALPESPSLDRIDSTKGYVKGNVWVISRRANTIKSDASLKELKFLVQNLERKLNENNSNTIQN